MLGQINIIQINVKHCAAAQNLLCQTSRERNGDVALWSEPFIPGAGNLGVLLDELGKAAIKCHTNLSIDEWEAVKGVHFSSCFALLSDIPE